MSRLPALARIGLFLVFTTGLAASPRPYLGDGNCLSCHGDQLPTLPSSGCVSCHAGNAGFLSDHAEAGPGGLAGAGTLTGGVLLGLLVLGFASRRRGTAAIALLATAALALPHTPGGPPDGEAWPGGSPPVARGHACDLQAAFSPSGDAVLFARRGPDTNEDGTVDLRDGQALFLLRREWRKPLRLTPYVLDFQPKMARWSPDGSGSVVPCPISDTNGDSFLAIGDRCGLLHFDSEGRRRAVLPPAGDDLTCPAFSPDGRRVACVEGRGIAVWDVVSGLREAALAPLPDGQFPRLWGWDLEGAHPLFSRGYDYRTLDRTEDGLRAFPPEVPLELARGGRAVTLTPPGPVPLRRYAAQAAGGRLFYLARSALAPTALYRFDGRREARWTPEGTGALGAFHASPSGTWALLDSGSGSARLAFAEGPGAVRFLGDPFPARQLGLAAAQDMALTCSPSCGGLTLTAWGPAAGRDAHSSIPGVWLAPAAAGGSRAAVRVARDTDGDGRLTALDEGELFVWWGGS